MSASSTPLKGGLSPRYRCNPANVEALMQTATAIADDRNGEIIVLTVVESENPNKLSEEDAIIKTARQLIDRAIQRNEEFSQNDVPVSGLIRSGPKPAQEILSTASQYNADELLIGWSGGSSPLKDIVFGRLIDTVANSADCDVLIERVGGSELKSIDSILVPISAGPHRLLSAKTAASLARTYDAESTLVSVVGPATPQSDVDSRKSVLDDTAATINDIQIETRMLRGENIAETIIAETNNYDLTIIGASGKGRLEEFVFDSITAKIARKGDGSIIITRRPKGVSSLERFRYWVSNRFPSG
ncbi:MAG: universal stress protein [Halobacteriaceae archaeon]